MDGTDTNGTNTDSANIDGSNNTIDGSFNIDGTDTNGTNTSDANIDDTNDSNDTAISNNGSVIDTDSIIIDRYDISTKKRLPQTGLSWFPAVILLLAGISLILFETKHRFKQSK